MAHFDGRTKELRPLKKAFRRREEAEVEDAKAKNRGQLGDWLGDRRISQRDGEEVQILTMEWWLDQLCNATTTIYMKISPPVPPSIAENSVRACNISIARFGYLTNSFKISIISNSQQLQSTAVDSLLHLFKQADKDELRKVDQDWYAVSDSQRICQSQSLWGKKGRRNEKSKTRLGWFDRRWTSSRYHA